MQGQLNEKEQKNMKSYFISQAILVCISAKEQGFPLDDIVEFLNNYDNNTENFYNIIKKYYDDKGLIKDEYVDLGRYLRNIAYFIFMLEEINKMKKKVFLGGTCSGYDWRKDFIKMIRHECNYYNPIVKNWCEEDRIREVHERQTCDYVLYVITSGLKGVYSIAEVIDDSNKRPERTILCILKDGINEQMYKSLKATANLARENGANVFFSLEDTANFLNSK